LVTSRDLPIVVRGAREHNLQNVDLTLARNQLICFTGVSGSGKSSLAFDTLYAEGQRRYLESLSTYARQFVGQIPKPDVDYLSGLSPSISISQKSTGNNPRSTVGTITEIHDFLRVLFARVGTGFCPDCQIEISSQTRDQMVEKIMGLDRSIPYLFLAPIVRGQKGEHKELFDDLRRQGFNRARINGRVYLLSDPPALERQIKHHVELVVDRISIDSSGRQRIAEAVDNALRFGEGTLLLAPMKAGKPIAATRSATAKPKKRKRGLDPFDTDTSRLPQEDLSFEQPDAPESVDGSDNATYDPAEDIVFSTTYACGSCGKSYPPPSPQLLSFNSPQGACKECEGLGESFRYDPELLVQLPDKSIKNGAIPLIGKHSEMTRWYRRSISMYCAALEAYMGLPVGRLLSTPWSKLEDAEREALLYGYQSVSVKVKGKALHGQNFRGIVPELTDTYRATSNPFIRANHERCIRIGRCPECDGSRLNAQARSIRLKTKAKSFRNVPWYSIGGISRLPIEKCSEFFEGLELSPLQWQIGEEAVKEIRARLRFLIDVGLGYLSLDRTAPTLSGGESQRIRLASQIGSGLVGVLYVLDEPSIGLHPRDNDRLLSSLKHLRDLGNTLIVVEHDEDTMRIADTLVDFGPGPGVRGGKLIVSGSLEDLTSNEESLTGGFLNRTRRIRTPEKRRTGNGKKLKIVGAEHHNLKNIDVEIPLGCFVAVTGVSGSGKSSLITEILSPAIRGVFQRGVEEPGKHREIQGIEHIDKVIDIDQSPIGRTPRSNPATYVKVFDEIRSLFAELPESKRRGFDAGTFSFNTEQGRCSACEGHGSVRLDMEFLADLWVPCAVCEGKRYDRATLQVEYKGKSIADCLELDVQQALEHFSELPKIASKLETLHGVGLDYIKLGQPSPTLSGGEAQRIKLSKELSRRSTGKTVYVLDEPTTGLHFYDIDLLLGVLQSLVDLGNTVIVVEHNLDLIQAADWVIDLGPEGGEGGGRVVCDGTPENIAKSKESHTGQALARYFESHRDSGKKKKSTTKSKAVAPKNQAAAPALEDIQVYGAEHHNLKKVDLTIPRNKMTVFCGQSGSGKTSMAMDTLYAEGQRRFVESLSPYVRQFVGQMPKAKVAKVEGLSPSIAIEQRNLSHTPRSTVGTVTEIYDYVRVLFARLAQMHCTQCDSPVSSQTSDQIMDRIRDLAREKGSGRALLLAPITPHANMDIVSFLASLRQQGFVRIRINGRVHSLDDIPALQHKSRNEFQLVVDRLQWDRLDPKSFRDSVDTALTMGNGVLQLAMVDESRGEVHWEVKTFSLQLACHACGISFQPLTPHRFSFNSQVGWCEACNGIGALRGINPSDVFEADKSLLDGGLPIWPDLRLPLARAMLVALSRETGLPIDRPIKQLTTGQRSMLLKGLPNRQIVVTKGDVAKAADPKASEDSTVYMTFHYRGVYEAVEGAANSSIRDRISLSKFMAEGPCVDCGGARVCSDAAHARYRDCTIADIVKKPIGALNELIRSWKLSKREQKIAGELVREIQHRLQFLCDVGLEYLTLDRSANTLSGGEAQRIRLASQLGAGLSGVLYVLDEPTIGLHPRDNERLIRAMKSLRDLGNTLVVVEHDREVIAQSDQLRDFGPASGPYGGEVVAQGTPAQISRATKSVTGPFLSGKKRIELPESRRVPLSDATPASVHDWTSVAAPQHGWLTIAGAQANSLKSIDVSIPVGCFTAVTGPSGSGKSSLINGILYPALARYYYATDAVPGPFREIKGQANFRKVLKVDQSPLGASPSSNPATYTGVFDHIRQLFNRLPEAKTRGLTAGHFSFNVSGGRCEKCEGLGQICIQMHFLPDVWIQCDACNGKRYTEEVLAVKFKGHSIDDVLNLSIGEARDLMSEIPKIHHMLTTLCDVGLDYLALGQSAPTLSGGEAQRVKLATELCRPNAGRTIYLLDEPTTGLHFNDIQKLLTVLQALVDSGNTVVVIEHNLDIIQCADWIIDLGPEAGEQGGEVVFAGPPEKLIAYASEETYRAPPISASQVSEKKPGRRKTATKTQESTAQTERRHRSYTGEALRDFWLDTKPATKSPKKPR
jgi:excinuclease ABC subunit A